MKKFRSNNKIAILGAGGHAGVCLDILNINKKKLCCFISPKKKNNDVIDPTLTMTDQEFLKKYKPDDVELINGIGIVPGKNKDLRKELFNKYKKLGYKFITLVHPSAIISKSSYIDESSQVMAGCIIQNNVTINKNSIINTGTIIEHNCNIGKNCHVAPGSILCGNVNISDDVFLSAGSIIKPNSEIKKFK